MASPLSPSNTGAIFARRPYLQAIRENQHREPVRVGLISPLPYGVLGGNEFYFVRSDQADGAEFMVTGGLSQIFSETDAEVGVVETLEITQQYTDPTLGVDGPIHFKVQGV